MELGGRSIGAAHGGPASGERMDQNRVSEDCGKSQPQAEKVSLGLGQDRAIWPTSQSGLGRSTGPVVALEDEQGNMD